MKRWLDEMLGPFIFGFICLAVTLVVWLFRGPVDAIEATSSSLLSLFTWRIAPLSFVMDMCMAFLLPIIVMGAARSAYSSEGGGPESDARSTTTDLEYYFVWTIGACLAALGYASSYGGKLIGVIPYGNFSALPICGIVLLIFTAIALLSSGWRKVAVPGFFTGFFTVSVFVGGAIHGWMFPWVIVAVIVARITFLHLSDVDPTAPRSATYT